MKWPWSHRELGEAGGTLPRDLGAHTALRHPDFGLPALRTGREFFFVCGCKPLGLWPFVIAAAEGQCGEEGADSEK